MSQEEVEYVDVECCHMCFSTERQLSSLDGVVEIYLLIVGLPPDCEESVNDVRACWECRAVLHRIFKFRRQAQWARNILLVADALVLDSETCMSKLKFTEIEKINLEHKLNLDIVRDVFEAEIAPKRLENINQYRIYDDTKGSSARNSSHGVFVQQDENELSEQDNKEHVQQDDNEQNIEAHTNATNMYHADEKELFCSVNTSVDIDPLAMEIKEEDDNDEGNFFDAEPACDQDQSNMDEKAISDIRTNMRTSNYLISNIKAVEKDNNVNTYNTVKPSTALDNHSVGPTETKRLMNLIDPDNLSEHDLTPRGQKVTMFSVKSKLDKDVIASQNPEKIIANSKNINMVESTKPRPNIKNIPSTLLQPDIIQKLDNIQSNVLTVRNINPLKEDSHKQNLYNTTISHHSQIDATLDETEVPIPLTEIVLSSDTAQYNVKENFTQMDLTPGQVTIVKSDENVKPIMERTSKKNPENMKELYESFHRGTVKSKPAMIIVTKVTKSELKDFLEQARNNEAYLASPFKCEFCILGFKEEHFLQRHMFRYKHETISKKEFVCDVCLSSMASERDLNEHQSTHDCLYSCTLDDFTSVLPLTVYQHCLEKHSLNKKYKTSLKRRPQANRPVNPPARRTEASPGSIKKRVRKKKIKVERQKRYEVFKPTKENFEYLRTSLSKGFFKCEHCCFKFHNSERLREHLKAHSESAGAHVCELCKLRFPTAELLRQHTPVHDEWYRCKADPACLYVAQRLSTIKMHIYNKHRTKSIRRIRPHVSHECSICKKVFQRMRSLKCHMLIHNKQHMCEVCGFFAPTTTVLANHKLRHTTEDRDYLVCEFCPKRFTGVSALKYHRNRHLNVKPFACKLCDEKFYTPSLRNSHVMTFHEKKQNVKNSICTLCNMDCLNNWTLTAHRATHEELQRHRHKCDKCPKSFFSFNSLVSHQESHAYIFECDICGKVFANRNTLMFHLHSKHNGGTETQKVKREKLKCNECWKVFRSVTKWRDHMKTHLIFPEDAAEFPEDTPELS